MDMAGHEAVDGGQQQMMDDEAAAAMQQQMMQQQDPNMMMDMDGQMQQQIIGPDGQPMLIDPTQYTQEQLEVSQSPKTARVRVLLKMETVSMFGIGVKFSITSNRTFFLFHSNSSNSSRCKNR